MSKRKAADQGGPEADTKVQPIPRLLTQKSITLHFFRRTWEEFAPGKLYYLPTSVNPKYMFNENMRNQMAKFKGFWETMEISSPSCRISNLVFLQDDLRVQSNTPTDATAFTQVCYLLHWTPAAQTEYFQLGNLVQRTGTKYNPLKYDLEPKEDQQFTLIGEVEYEGFDKLLAIPAKINKFAGWDPGSEQFPKSPYSIKKPYFGPGEFNGDISCNLQVENSDTYYLHSNKVIAYAQDMDHLHLYKYGDTVNLEVETNLNGSKLYKHVENDFLKDTILEYKTDTDKVVYDTEWMYPGNNRPLLCRCYNFDARFSCTQHNKGFKPLKHHFISMPPIKKPNGALLGQRCSVMVEQSFSVTFNAHEATFEGYDEQTDADVMAQNNAVIIRRGIYGDAQSGGKPPPTITGGILCPYGMNCETEGGLCAYDNNWEGFATFVCEQAVGTAQQILTTYQTKPAESNDTNTFDLEGFGGFTKENMEILYPEASTALYDLLERFRIPEQYVYFKIPPNIVLYGYDAVEDDKPVRYVWPIYLVDSTGSRCTDIINTWKINAIERKTVWIRLSCKALAEAIATSSNIDCNTQFLHTDYRNNSKTISVFFK